MFGSLRIGNHRLDDEQTEIYRGHFCGACHAMHRFGGRLSSVLTNYDQTLLGVVLGGMLGESRVIRRPCTAFPLRKVGVIDLGETCQNFLAAVNLTLVEAKLLDDAEDENRWRTRAGRFLIRSPAQRALSELSTLGLDTRCIEEITADQAAVERSTVRSLDALAGPSATVTGEIFAFVAQLTNRGDQEENLRRFGRALGAFIYIWDAWVDQEEDRDKGRFNAIQRRFGTRGDPRRQGVEVADELQRHADTLEDTTNLLPLGSQRAVVVELLATLRTKAEHQVRPLNLEAGVCDACDACACCEAGEGCAGCADCCACGCDCWLCGNTDKRRAKRKKGRS